MVCKHLYCVFAYSTQKEKISWLRYLFLELCNGIHLISTFFKSFPVIAYIVFLIDCVLAGIVVLKIIIAYHCLRPNSLACLSVIDAK